MHSVTGYLFLYDPDHNYIYKATHARKFADCVEFYDDWGYGDTVNLSIYYRMCDELVSIIKSNKELLATDGSRFSKGWGEDPETFYDDPEKHVLAFDLIYCCTAHNLFDGISFTQPKTKDRQLIQEKKAKALSLSQKLITAREEFRMLQEAKEYIDTVFIPGTTIQHTTFGTGIIKESCNNQITVEFSDKSVKRLGKYICAANGLIMIDDSEYKERISRFQELLKKESLIASGLSYAEKEFAQYAEYLD